MEKRGSIHFPAGDDDGSAGAGVSRSHLNNHTSNTQHITPSHAMNKSDNSFPLCFPLTRQESPRHHHLVIIVIPKAHTLSWTGAPFPRLWEVSRLTNCSADPIPGSGRLTGEGGRRSLVQDPVMMHHQANQMGEQTSLTDSC